MAGRARDPEGYSLGQAQSRAVAVKVRALLEKEKRTQYSVSKATEIPASHLSDLLGEDGRRRFQRWQVVAIARAFGISERDLLSTDVATAVLGGHGTSAVAADPVSASDAQRRLREHAARYAERHQDDITPRERRFLENLLAVPETGREFSDAEYESFFAGLLAGLRAPKALVSTPLASS